MDRRRGYFLEKERTWKRRQWLRYVKGSSESESISMVRSVIDLREILNRDQK
jgi:hypothetical protein